MRIRYFFLLLFCFKFSFSQEIKTLSKTKFEHSFNTAYLGKVADKHYAISYDHNAFRTDFKDIDEDQMITKIEYKLLIFNEQTQFEKEVVLVPEYKYQDLLFTGLINNQISIIYVSKKAKGTIVQNFDLNGTPVNFELLSEEKKGNFFKSTDSNKYVLHFTEENCYVYNNKLKNIDKFPFQSDEILDIYNYLDGFLILSHKNAEVELTRYSQSKSVLRQKITESNTWVHKSPRLSLDQNDPSKFYISSLIGKKEGHTGGWDLSDSRQDYDYRSKGIKLYYFAAWENIRKERSILFESNIIYGTNSNANSEQVLGCTNLNNLGVTNFGNSLLIVLEEQMMTKTETLNPLTGSKKVTHSFKYNDLILVKTDEQTSIQSFIIRGCNLNMDENQLGSVFLYAKNGKIKVMYNQTYLRENKNKLLAETLDQFLESESKVLCESINDSGLNIVLNPPINYVKSKYFLALQSEFIDLIYLEE